MSLLIRDPQLANRTSHLRLLCHHQTETRGFGIFPSLLSLKKFRDFPHMLVGGVEFNDRDHVIGFITASSVVPVRAIGLIRVLLNGFFMRE
jgi:hypothetical protein